MVKDLEFVQYISAKICHDLAGSLSALSNGVEFIDSADSEVRKKAIELIHMSSVQAIDTLKLFRQVYGIAKYDGEADLGSIKELCQVMIKDKGINLEFLIPNSLPAARALDVNTGKLMLAVVGLAKSNLIHGGTITVSIHHHGDHNAINIVSSGIDMKAKSESNKIISSKDDNFMLSSHNIEAYYIKRLKDAISSNITINENVDKVEYIIEYKS